jgi:hypothetical protein
MDILEKFVCVPDLGEIYVKDMDFSKFCKKFGQLAELTAQMRSRLPDGYRNYLVDLIVQDCRPGKQTCRDIRWHVDGDFESDNRYVLWVRGPNRTQFPSLDLKDQMGSMGQMDRNRQNEFLEKMLVGIPVVSVPDMTLVSYDSKTPHRGVRCVDSGVRTFFRILATNYVKPKNIIKESLDAQLRQAV